MEGGAEKTRGAKHFPLSFWGLADPGVGASLCRGGCAGLCTANSSRATPPTLHHPRPRECMCSWGRRKVLRRRMGVGRQPGQASCHLRPSPGVLGLGAPSMDSPPLPGRCSQLGPHPRVARRSLSAWAARSPPPAARVLSPPSFSPPLAPSSSSSSSSPPAPSCSHGAVPTHSLAPFGERCLFRAG